VLSKVIRDGGRRIRIGKSYSEEKIEAILREGKWGGGMISHRILEVPERRRKETYVFYKAVKGSQSSGG